MLLSMSDKICEINLLANTRPAQKLNQIYHRRDHCKKGNYDGLDMWSDQVVSVNKSYNAK